MDCEWCTRIAMSVCMCVNDKISKNQGNFLYHRVSYIYVCVVHPSSQPSIHLCTDSFGTLACSISRPAVIVSEITVQIYIHTHICYHTFKVIVYECIYVEIHKVCVCIPLFRVRWHPQIPTNRKASPITTIINITRA